MASEVEICNVAISQVLGRSINSLSEASREAQECTLFYSTARDQVLTEHDWGFNTKLIALSELTVEIFNWAHVWSYPTDCLKINRLVRNIQLVESQAGTSAVALRFDDFRARTPRDLPPVQYEVMNEKGTRVIVTQESCMRANYSKRITDPNLMTVNARMAISQLLASYIAIPIAGVKDGTGLKAIALALYTAWKSKASDQDGNEGFEEAKESDYILVRESS